MFRYIGFSWSASSQAESCVAERLECAIQARGVWRPALRTSGLRVFTTGNAQGVNDIYALPSNRGVILGHLFRRHDPKPAEPGVLALTEAEGQRIVSSDGLALIEHYWGRYIAFLPSWSRECRVLRDPTGTLPCFRMEVQGVSIVLSWLEDVLSLLEIPAPPVNWNAVAAHMLLGRLSGRETALQGVTQVLPGELTPISSSSGAPRVLWSAADVARQPTANDQVAAVKLLRQTTRHCTQSWAASYESVVLRLSGGVDSAILLAGICDGIPPQRVSCLNYHSPGSDSDERSFARLAAERAGTALIERERDAGFRLEEVLNVARMPVPPSYIGGMGTSHMDAEVAAALQAGAIFTGAGGDQLFFEYRCAWPASDYLRHRGFDLGFLEAALDAAHLGRVSFWRAMLGAIADLSFRGDPAAGAGRYLTLMRRDAMTSAGQTSTQFVHPGWLAAADLPIGKFHQVGALISPFDYYNAYRPDASPELVHPLMSQPLLELCLATPTYTLTRGGQGRALARRAFAAELPPRIASRRSKGGIEEHITTVLQRNLPFARELLLDGLLARQGLLDLDRVEVALSDRPSTNAAYVTEIHTCIAIEVWARRLVNSPNQTKV